MSNSNNSKLIKLDANCACGTILVAESITIATIATIAGIACIIGGILIILQNWVDLRRNKIDTKSRRNMNCWCKMM